MESKLKSLWGEVQKRGEGRENHNCLIGKSIYYSIDKVQQQILRNTQPNQRIRLKIQMKRAEIVQEHFQAIILFFQFSYKQRCQNYSKIIILSENECLIIQKDGNLYQKL
ncbi:unnamed protein product [Paramecium pentaurelia]|uniref:Uncharacterized protein n=1 Tax=Paramecium pentaurelia TaxID=43138 RepID=A0A8S1WFI3_9CILI|nr:unnamed protein product [Paramecium pentaurelia]